MTEILLTGIPVCSETSPLTNPTISLLPILGLGIGLLLTKSGDGVIPSLRVPVVYERTNVLFFRRGCGNKLTVSSVNCLRHSNLLIFPDVVLRWFWA